MILVYPFMAVILVAFTLLSWVLSPILALLVNEDGNLPRRLRWFQTFDASVDEGWRGGYYGEVPSEGIDHLSRWWYRVCWLCRNPGYGFAEGPLGVAWRPGNWQVWFKRSRNGRDMVFWAWSVPDMAFDLHFRWGFVAGKFGWKAWNNFDEATLSWKPAPWAWRRLPLCFSPQVRFK